MNSRTLKLISPVLIFFFLLAMLSVGCSPSNAQNEGGRREPYDRSRKAGQVNPVQRYHQLLEEMKKKGYDVSEAMKLDERARSEMRQGNRRKARRLVQEAIASLEALETGRSHTPWSSGDKEIGKPTVIELPVSSSKVYVTESVPRYESGRDIKDYNRAFQTEMAKAHDGKISLKVGPIPLFIEEEESIQNDTSGSEDSPFGIEAKVPLSKGSRSLDTCEGVAELGAKWVRYCQPQGLVWGLIEKEKGIYDWASLDYQVSQAQKVGLNVKVLIYPYAAWDDPEARRTGHGIPAKLPNDMDAFLRFIEQSVERYDGDGISDAPGSPSIKYWEVGTEMGTPFKWRDTPQNYALLLKKTYKAIKKADPQSKVLMAGWVNGDKRSIEYFWTPVLEELKKLSDKPSDTFFDICSLHWFLPDVAGLVRYLGEVRLLFSNLGFESPAIWITSLATFSGNPKGGPVHRIHVPRSESMQAQDVVKLYIAALANGVEKIFWGKFFGLPKNLWWDNSGLITHPRRKGGSYKKLAYYTYKLMTEKLGSSDWSDIKALQYKEKEVHVYKFKKRQSVKATYVAWADTFDG